MNSGVVLNQTPTQQSHGHYVDYIEFPSSMKQGPSYASLEDQNKAGLKAELVSISKNKEFVKDAQCFKQCFNLTQPEYYSYCLEQKCGQKNLEFAARVAGYYKPNENIKKNFNDIINEQQH